MIRQFFLLFFALLTIACRTTKSTEKKCYKNSKTILSIHWSEQIFTHSYIKLKKGNYFEFYQRLVWSTTKTIQYRGQYAQLNDTLFFKFCGDTIPDLLTKKVLINKSKNEIILLTENPRLNHYFKISLRKR